MPDITNLMTLLQPHLGWHRARLFCFAALILAVLRLRTVCLASLAVAFNPRRKPATNYRRLQRFFALFTPDPDHVTALLLALRASDTPLTLVLDRTEWKLGTKRVNLLVVGYLFEGFVIPLRWIDLDKPGASSQQERLDLLQPLIKQIGRAQIKALVADREFIGEAFFHWMQRQRLRFVIRIRRNARMYDRGRATTRAAGEEFAALALGRRRRLREKRVIYGCPVYVVAAREAEAPWIVVTNERPSEALALYGQRWSIETTFAALKSRGFDLEGTHLRQADRLEKLVAVLSVALLWAVKVGQWRTRRRSISVKKHGRRAVSVFRYGLDYLRQHLWAHDWDALRPAFQLLSCT